MSVFTLDWLHLNCMEIFHYLANQLKGTPIFENDHRKIDKNKESGAVFNDFNFQPDELLWSNDSHTVFGTISNSTWGLIKIIWQSTTFNVAQKIFFWRQGKSCYNTLQWVTKHYKKLQKIGMRTNFNVAQEIFYLKEGEKL